MEVLLVYKKRAEDGTRIRDPNLGKVVLYQLSYFRNNVNVCLVLLSAFASVLPRLVVCVHPFGARLCSTN